MKRFAARVFAWFTLPSGLTGGFLGAAIFAVQPGGTGLLGLLLGWLYGAVVGGLLRLFRVPPGAYPLTGLLAGPLPIALLLGASANPDARGLVWVGFLAGLVIGTVEWAVARRARGHARAAQLGEPAAPPLD